MTFLYIEILIFPASSMAGRCSHYRTLWKEVNASRDDGGNVKKEYTLGGDAGLDEDND